MRRIPYSSEERAFIRDRATSPRREAYEQFIAAFDRADVSLDAFKHFCKRNRWMTGRTGRLLKGSTPWNKGKAMPFNAKNAATQFKKGHAPHNTKWLGHERLSRHGYVEISIAETNPHTGFERRHVFKHVYLWTLKNGPVPKGMALKCVDGNKLNTSPENWELVSRSMLPRLAGHKGKTLNYSQAPAELKPALMMVAKLEDKIRRVSS